MPLSKFVVSAAVAIALGAAAFAAYAQDITITPDPTLSSLSVEDMVAKRQGLMKLNGATLKNAGSLTGADAVAAAETLIANFSDLTVLFPEGSDTVPGSEAKPEIWQNFDAFQAMFVQGATAATAMKAAAEAGDAAAYGAAIKTIGPLCGGACHQQFRAS
jgi:cytochrome c556